MRTVDVHAHVIVPELLRDAAPEEQWRPRVRRGPNGPLIELDGRTIGSAVDEFVELDGILALCDKRGVDHVVLSPWVPLLFYGVAAEEGLERCRLQNAGLSALRARAPQRVSVLGAVPLQDPELAAAELEALMAGGDFVGVEITASVNGAYLGDETLAPFWAAAERTDALVFVHPTTRGFQAPIFERHYLSNLVGNPMETTLAAADLVLGGTLTRHPRLRVLLAHGGGTIVALGGRLRHGQATVTAAGPPPVDERDAADALIRRFLFDTITHDPRLLAALVDLVGADRVLLGTDHPFDMADPHPVQTVGRAGLDDAARDALLGGNAARELGLGAGID